MSATKRFLSGSAAGVASIFVVVLNQLALVPIFLSHWTVEEFGVWLAVQAMLAFSTVFSFGYQTYWEFEFLKTGNGSREKTGRLLYSAIPVVWLLGAMETAGVFLLVTLGGLSYFLSLSGAPASLVDDAGLLLIIQSVNWLVFIATAGLAQRAIVPYGYYPRNAWWYVVGSFVSAVAAAVAVLLGANLLLAGTVQAFAYGLFSVALHWNLWSILKRESILPVRPDIRSGVLAILPSLVLAAKTLLGMVQQQGIRILLAGVLGLRDLAAFATMRTVSNVALQGVGTVVNPMTPELMRFAVARDSERVRGSFGVIWLFAVFAMGVGLILLQGFAPWLFNIWTLGKIDFDPLVFSVLSVSLIVFGFAQPAISLVRGNNILQPQIIVTVIGALITIGSIFFLIPIFGVLAAALGLLLAEIIGLLVYVRVAKRWLVANEMIWPENSAALAFLIALTSAIAITMVALYPKLTFSITVVVITVDIWFALRLWNNLPDMVHKQVNELIERTIKRFYWRFTK